jgi:hypothetical protein
MWPNRTQFLHPKLIRNGICKELIPKRQQSMFLHPKLCDHSFRYTTDALLSSTMHACNTLNYSARSLIAIPMISLIQKLPQNLNLQNTSFDRFQTSYTLGHYKNICHVDSTPHSKINFRKIYDTPLT